MRFLASPWVLTLAIGTPAVAQDHRPEVAQGWLAGALTNIEAEVEAVVVFSCGRAATRLIDMGDVESAHWFLEQGLAVTEQSDQSKYQIFKAATTLGSPLQALGDEEGILRLQSWKVRRQRKFHDLHEEAYLDEVLLLGHALRNVSDRYLAFQMYLECCRARNMVFTDDQAPFGPDAGRVSSGAYGLYYEIYFELSAIGDHALAEIFFDDYLEGLSAALERDPSNAAILGHRTTADIILAERQYRSGATSDAIARMRDLVAKRLRRLEGKLHPWQKIQMPNNLRLARLTLADMLEGTGQLAEAERIKRAAFETIALEYPPGHNWRQDTVESLARTLHRTGESDESVRLMEDALEVETSRHEVGHRDRVTGLLFLTCADLVQQIESGSTVPSRARTARGIRLAGEMCEQATTSLATTARQYRTIAASGAVSLDKLLMISADLKGAEDSIFTLIETRRHRSTLGFGSPEQKLSEKARSIGQLLWPRYHGPSNNLHAPGEAQRSLGDEAERDRFSRALIQIDDLRRSYARAAIEGGAHALDFSPTAVAGRLGPEAAAVTYFRHTEYQWDPESRAFDAKEDRLLAMVLTADGRVTRIDIGPAHDIRQLVDRWRESIHRSSYRSEDGLQPSAKAGSVGDAKTADLGQRLQEMVLQQVLQIVGARVKTLYVCSDDALHSLPLDALPLHDACVGNSFRILPVVSLGQLFDSRPRLNGAKSVLAVGGIDFNADAGTSATEVAIEGASRAALNSLGPWGQLKGSKQEVDRLAELIRKHPEWRCAVVTGADATKATLFEVAGVFDYIHMSTHGWQALGRLDAFGRENGAKAALEGIIEFAPGLACGLCLAGANRMDDRATALVTAEELRWQDLTSCHLLTLAACDTNVGWSRAGLGSHSFQVSGHAAGARFVISSLWEIDDRSTEALMGEFYRRHIVEGEPVPEALWSAKMEMRSQQRGLESWAGLALSGVPD